MWPTLLICLYSLLIAVASVAGGMLPMVVRFTHTWMQVILSAVGGLVLGVGLLHLIPHSAAETNSLDWTVGAALCGLLFMFFLIRIFHVHQHGPVQSETEDRCGGEHHQHLHDYPTDAEHCDTHSHAYSWLGLFVGLAFHTIFDGVALAASVAAAAHDKTAVGLLGSSTFLAVLLHKPLDAMSITSVMTAGNWSQPMKYLVNIAFASMCAVGALGFYWGVSQMNANQHFVVGVAMGFAAGVFLCISLADILPELQFHSHDRLKLSAALLVGVALAYGIGWLEPAHTHSHGFPDAHQPPTQAGAHDHGQHDHNHSHDEHDHGHDGHGH